MRTCNDTNLDGTRNVPISIGEIRCEIGGKFREAGLRGGFAPAGLPQFLHFAGEIHASALDAMPVGVVDAPDDLAATFFLHVPAARVGAADREPTSLATVFECACVHDLIYTPPQEDHM